MGISLITAIEIGQNYPEGVSIESLLDSSNGKYGAVMYRLKDEAIHKVLVSMDGFFDTEDKAIDHFNKLGSEMVERLPEFTAKLKL